MVRRILVLVVLSLVSWQGVRAAVTARFDRDSIRLDETVRLQVQSDDVANAAEPDFTVLSEHFRILGQSSGQNISIVNGRQSATRTWTLELEPRSVGSFTIDPVTVGGEQSAPLRISVLPESSAAPGSSDVFIEVESDAESVYVQQQLVFTARIFVGVPVVDASISDPAPADTVVRRLGGDHSYGATRGGRDYRVFERRYALFPQASGSLEIPPLRFQGVVDESGLGGRGFGSLFNRGKRIRARSRPIEVAVKPPLALQPGETWLPAQQLQIHDLSEPVSRYRVGEPVTLKLQLQALGLTAEQLPELVIPRAGGLRLYPDRAEKETHDDEENIIGIQLSRIAVIPEQAGELTIPGIELAWWNVATDSREIATLPSRTISVEPAAAPPMSPSPPTGTAPTAATDLPPAPEPVAVDSVIRGGGGAGYWKWLALGSLGLWALLALALWRRSRTGAGDGRTSVADPRAGEKAAAAALKASCLAGDALAARHHLVQWARSHYSRDVTLDELGTLTGDTTLAREVERLNRHLYAPGAGTGSWSGESLWTAFGEAARRRADGSASAPSSLQDLYPE